MINQKSISFASQNGISNISGIAYYPEQNNRRGYFQVIHDKYENIERYRSILTKFAEYGYVSFGHDHQGHGRSIRKPEEIGTLIGDYPEIRLIDDSHNMFNFVTEELPTLESYTDRVPDENSTTSVGIRKKIIPHIILGVGIGATIAKLYLMKYPDVNMMILCGDKGLNPFRSIDLLYCKYLINKFGQQTFHSKFEKWIERQLNAHVDSPITGYEWRINDSKQLNEFLIDPEVPKHYSLGYHYALLKLHSFCTTNKWLRAYPRFLSTFFIAGKYDPISNYTRYLSPYTSKLSMYGAQNIFYKFYDDARHDLLFEKNRQEVYRDIYRFIKKTEEQQFKQ